MHNCHTNPLPKTTIASIYIKILPLAVYDKLINIKRKTTEMSMTEPQHIRHNQINPRQVT